MKDETAIWLEYAAENLASAQILLDSGLFNSCLQNIQQCVEKLLKAVLVEFYSNLVKTHNISKLKQILTEKGTDINITNDECDLLDTIYLPSKYPIGRVIPEYNPDADICRDCIAIASRVNKSVKDLLGK
ncbi:MAG: HEPN domain-containing protein [Desulfobacterales bacterium]|jgi:HEPN domain-containing protein|nr:HEPN domain-containing protein [Desulfobacterales bacterium]